MPELPEVETLSRYLKNQILGEVITSIDVNQPKLRFDCAHLLDLPLPTRIIDIKRRAKYLIFTLDNDYAMVLHLGMSGKFVLYDSSYNTQKHDHVILHLASGDMLVFNDTRRFGMLCSAPLEGLFGHEIFCHIGPEPLSGDLTMRYLQQKFFKRKSPIKTTIMDNKILVGVGNIYAAESLFRARINPLKPAAELSVDEIERLIKAIKAVLEEAILQGGTTLRDFVSGDNTPGYFQQKLLVYAREGETCYNCSSKIMRIVQGGRSTFFCPVCQDE